ncbi:MAG: carboxypeptidase regulatory-like domain-containing protein [Bacilli bacterium]|nr:carboxypeptidase regulatory-like domain-containing protein [Bacilli bacterium]
MKSVSRYLLPLSAVAVLAAVGGGIAVRTNAGADSVTYSSYDPSKSEGDGQFDFSGKKPASNINFDGKKDNAYGTTPFLTYGGASGNSVKAYSFHDDDSLFLFFEVKDTNVLTQATGSNNAYNEDGIEIYIDPLADGGTSPRTDDIQLNLGLSGFSRRLKGTGTGWKTASVYMEYKSTLMPNTTLNNESDVDEGYNMEIKIPLGILGITKESPACMTFAHADLSHRGDSRKWYGLSGRTDQYMVASSAIPDGYLVLAPNEKLYSKKNYEASLVSNPTVYGHVVDGQGNPVAGASISAYSSYNPDRTYSMETGIDGSFYFDNVDPNFTFHVSIAKTGYSNFSYTISQSTLAKCMSGVCSKEINLYPKYLSKVNIKGSVSSFVGSLSGFKVAIEGEDSSITTDASGKFTIPVYAGSKNTILISKEGYEGAKIVVDPSEAVSGTVLDNVEMFPELALLGVPGTSDPQINSVTAYAGRSQAGIVLKLDSKFAIEGDEKYELFINTGDSSFAENFNRGDYRFVLDGESGPHMERFEPNEGRFIEIPGSGEDIEVVSVNDALWTTYCFIPAASFGKAVQDTVGIAGRFHNGKTYEATTSTLAPEGKLSISHTAAYPRLDKDGKVFFAYSNDFDTSKETMYIHALSGAEAEAIPENADTFFLTYGKTATGLEMEIVVDEGFSYHTNAQYKIRGIEALNVVLNLDDLNQASWAMFQKGAFDTSYDLNFRIYSDDTICYRASHDFEEGAANQLWWSDHAHNNGTSKYVETKKLSEDYYQVEKIPGATRYTLKFSYDDLLRLSDATTGKTISQSKNITFAAWEVSETSKTTIRFYATSDRRCFILKDKEVTTVSTALGDQKNYHPIPTR